MPAAQNQLIQNLPPPDRAKLLALCEPAPLPLGEVLCRPGDVLPHVYFPVDSFISLVASTDERPGLEVGMVGREGMLGVHVTLGMAEAPLLALVQGAGSAWRVEAVAFSRMLAQSSALQRIVHRYIHVLMCQFASSAACLRFHLIAPRLARWLLMSQDRAHSARFRVTQQSLAYMLGVRRVGITAAAGALQRGGLISYVRGDMTVLDRRGLEAAACSCYATDSNNYTKTLGRRAVALAVKP